MMRLNEADRNSILTQTYTTVGGRTIQIATGLRLKNNPDRKADYDRAIALIRQLTNKSSGDAPANNSAPKSTKPNKRILTTGQRLKLYDKFKAQVNDFAIKELPGHHRDEWNESVRAFRNKFKTNHSIQEFIANMAMEVSSVDTIKDVKIDYVGAYILHNEIRVSTRLGVTDHAGNESSISIIRIFNPRKKLVKHSEFEIEDPNLRGHGIAKKIFKSSLQFYDSIGLQSITLEAGMSAGGYAWLRFGAIPNKSSWTRLRGEILDTLYRYKERDNIPKSVVTLMTKLANQTSSKAALAIAAIPYWGRQYLSGTWWHGAFDLKKNTLSRKTLEGYLQSA